MLSANDLGFGLEAELRDRTQMQFVASLMRQGASRFILKGGMAMRALYGSVRLTKDVDFDCEGTVSQQSMQSHLPKALLQAARIAGLTGIDVTQTKKANLSNRWRVRGATGAGLHVTWEVEISRRGIPPAQFIETRRFEVPAAYRLPNFTVRVYGPAAMAGGKVNALLSDNRSVPRDVYDLHELIRQQADPTLLWIQRVSRKVLQSKRKLVTAKIDRIGFDLANAELLPYIAPDIRAMIDAARWDEIRLEVAEQVEHWIAQAIKHAMPAQDMHNDADNSDLAGR
jgi:predicted nucleotidyltransferase component of viral defense system